MLYHEIIVDADFCIKLGASEKYRYLERLLPLLADKIYIHETVNDEVKTPRGQLESLISDGTVTVLSEKDLSPKDEILYTATFQQLANVMLDKKQPHKNRGEVSSLAMAKVKGIPCFVTDERELQNIVDAQLNTGINDISCVRLIDIIEMIKGGMIPELARKDAKLMWIISGKKKNLFDEEIWPIDTK